MSEPAIQLDEEAVAPAAPSRTRHTLMKRLADLVSLPASRINSFERSVTGDLLVDMLKEARPEDRQRVAMRLAALTEAPNPLIRMLLRDDVEVAGPLLDECAALNDADLVGCARDTTTAHRLRMASRRGLSEIVSETLLSFGEASVIEAVLKNTTARLSQVAVEAVVTLSRQERTLCAPLLRRGELRPSGAYVMFWWCEAEERKTILSRFAVSREVMQDAAEDLFAMIAAENWSDPVARKALQFIERRQRNRAAIAKSPYGGLEQAVAAAAEGGLSRELLNEISHLAGVKPITGAKIFGDPAGEPLAILCKATGMGRVELAQLWIALRRPQKTAAGEPHPDWVRVQTTLETLAVDRAQTVLRYWNWSLSSALTPTLLRAIRDGEHEVLDEVSLQERAAMLTLSQTFGA